MRHPQFNTLDTHNANAVGVIQAFPVHRVHCFSKISCMTMVARLLEMVTDYEKRLRTMQHVPGFSYGSPMLRDDGCPNRFFFTYLFCDQAMAIEYLKDVGLLRSKMTCNTCGQDMTWTSDASLRERFRWRCQRRVAGTRCVRQARVMVPAE